MFRFLNRFMGQENQQEQHGKKKDQVEELINEVGRELGVNEKTRSIDTDPGQFAERISEEIKKRK
ncbi:hypothetical protein [Thermoactinomyces mirandus]|uniref:Uncharacterized protein n=1 Tax=Thermoactinomyces mirandus TaxID=2756294 RepID=A0A7W1XUG4_9BACL|nr:hypothetical protein [Thermoactinomyces mirandus]MBA4603450.1 hypothetical protein [Thermoactinomyces mirandus]